MNDNPYLNEESSKSGVAGISGFMLGALVGAGVALLFAPATGTDTRRKLGETAKRLGSAARDKIQEGKSQIQDRIQEGKSQIQDRFQGSQGFEAGSQTSPGRPESQGQYGQGRREPVPSTGSTNPGQAGTRPGTTAGRTTP